MPLVLAVVTFLAYWPSLKSDFVYDARTEILQEGFITSISNLPAVLSLKVLSMNLLLAQRPGQLLYLMLIAAVCGKEPFGYHLCSNLLHAANAALLFLLLRRLMATELGPLQGGNVIRSQLAAAVVTLIFALHPLSVESAAEVSYSSSLLVTFFTLLALLAAISFRPGNPRVRMLAGSAGVFCAFAAVTCKESGVTVAALLIVYWFLFRREEARKPWFLFLGAAMAVTVLFLVARFHYAVPASQSAEYLGGSFGQVFVTQPGLWVFMMGKLLWPTHLSADYILINLGNPSLPVALAILIPVVLLQGWLALKSRMGALGVAIYWLGLATVSNFVPLFSPLADRFYYLPLAGVSMQLLALFLMALTSRRGFWMALTPFIIALLPLTLLTLDREKVFSSESTLWNDTAQVSPLSLAAHSNLGGVALHEGRLDEALAQYQKVLEIQPNSAKAHYNLGVVLSKRGQIYEAIDQYQKALEIDPNDAKAHDDMGIAFLHLRRMDEAIVEFRKALEIAPGYSQIHNDLGVGLAREGRTAEAQAQFQEAVRLNPDDQDAQSNLANATATLQHGMAPR